MKPEVKHKIYKSLKVNSTNEPVGKRLVQTPRSTWVDNIKMGLKETQYQVLY
jgi:hypothetical protein